MLGGWYMAERTDLYADIEYYRVALQLSARQFAEAVRDATGSTVNPESTGLLESLSTEELEALSNRLSAHPGWKKPQ